MKPDGDEERGRSEIESREQLRLKLTGPIDVRLEDKSLRAMSVARTE